MLINLLKLNLTKKGEKKDKFATKASEKGQKSYIIRSIEFSPDS